MTYQDKLHLWQDKVHEAQQRARRIEEMIHRRARATCKQAGLDPDLLGIHPHNAMVSLHYGHPWRGVNYSLVRKTQWLLNKQFEPSRIVDKYSSRLWKTLQLGGDAMNNPTLSDIIDKTDRFSCHLSSYHGGEWTDVPLTDVRDISWRDLTPDPAGDLYIPRLLSFGDYDNSCDVERSNHRVFLDMFKHLLGVSIWTVWGDFYSKAIAIDISANEHNEEMVEVLAALENYPVIDEDDLSQLDIEMQDEAWKDMYERDFRELVNKEMQAYLDNEDYEVPEEIDLFSLFNALCDQSNTYWECEAGGNMWIDLERVMEKFDPEKFDLYLNGDNNNE